MKKRGKRLISFILASVLMVTSVIAIPSIASASIGTAVTLEDYGIDFWADCEGVLSDDSLTQYEDGDANAMLGGINPHKIETSASTYYLFLPSTADVSNMTFYFSGTATLDGVTLTSGEASTALAGIANSGEVYSYSLVLNGTTYSLGVMKSNDVSTVYITTDSGSLSTITSTDHDTYEAGSIMVVEPDGTVDYNGIMEKMSGRGNGTWSTSNTKNPYNIKLATSTSLLGMEKAKKWCLLANAGDGTLLKNTITYDFSKYIGVQYQPICKPVDLYVNQQYLGSYVLTSKVEIKSNRVALLTDAYENLQLANGTTDETTGIVTPADWSYLSDEVPNVKTYSSSGTSVTNSASSSSTIYQGVGYRRYSATIGGTGSVLDSGTSLNDPTDVTGGYLYELEITNRWIEENAGFCAYNRQSWVLKSCDYATKSMVDYSYDLLYALGGSVYNDGVVPSTKRTYVVSSASMTDETAIVTSSTGQINSTPASQYQGLEWSDLLDADSAVLYYWTQEFFKNMDSSTSSTYFYKDSDTTGTQTDAEGNQYSILYAGPVWDMDNSMSGYDGTSASRWGYSYTSTDGWYTKNVRIYRWSGTTSTTTSTTWPLAFYAALATNCSDFWTMAEKCWYSTISPAVDVLLGNTVDKTQTLRSVGEYVDEIQYSAQLNAVRFGTTYDSQTIESELTEWISERDAWIDSEIGLTDISDCTIESISNQTYTGSEICPSLNITYTENGVTFTLEEGVDYTVSYSNNVNALSYAGAVATITGIGAYTGSVDKTFKITSYDLSSATLSIIDSAYMDTEIYADLENENGDNITAASFQWYRDGVAIDSATEQTYTTTSDDCGTVITVVASGTNNSSLSGSVTSNECAIATGSRPTGYDQALATWDYDYTADSTTLTAIDSSDYEYLATGGTNQSSACLSGTVDNYGNGEIHWSGTDTYTNTTGSVTPDQEPVISTSKTEFIAWDEGAGFTTCVSTIGYDSIKFSAYLGGTKKAPADWALQYSTDGETYTDLGVSYHITVNKEMELAFDSVELPDDASNCEMLYIRIVITDDDLAINGTDYVLGTMNGDIAINNIKITGVSQSVTTNLSAPTITESSSIYDTDTVTITDNNGGADVYYTIDGGDATLYSSEFNPFDSDTAQIGDTVTVTAYSQYEDITSESVEATYVFLGVDVIDFVYDTYNENVLNGAVPSTGGVYEQSGRMSAYTDGSSQYVAYWKDSASSFVIAPDDGAKWSEESGFTYKISTAGFENVTFTCDAYTTAQGPNSVSLQYSLDGVTYYTVTDQENIQLSANGVLENFMQGVVLPSACDNQAVVYIRLATTEDATRGDSTTDSTSLWDNNSKGNLYVNNVIFAAQTKADTYKMPFTNKQTNYFGSGTVEYIQPDGVGMKYIVADSENNIVASGDYPQGGIQLSSVSGFNQKAQELYYVAIWAGDDDDQSVINTATYCYKGETITEFNYNSTTRLFDDYVSSDALSVSATTGSGTLSMSPDTVSNTTLTYTGTYGVKVSNSTSALFTATKDIDNPDGNGYWLIETSTLGYTDVTLNLEQLSSNKGPRNWGIAYSLDGENYTYVENSNSCSISNDAISDTVSTYQNFPLPSDCDNAQTLYIKVFINGGESVDGTELETTEKGNIGINKIELNGIALPSTYDLSLTTSIMTSPTDTVGVDYVSGVSVALDGEFYGTTDENGLVNITDLNEEQEYTITLYGDGITQRTLSVTLTEDTSMTVPVLTFDANNDSIVNAKDFAILKRSGANGLEYFSNFINEGVSSSIYQ